MSIRTLADEILNPVLCPVCRRSLLFYDERTRIDVDPITGKETETLFRELECLDCGWKGEYVPWRETRRNGNASSHTPLPLTQPPPRSNMALILDAQRMVLASCESCGVAVFRAQSFEHAEYIVWCTGSVLKRVRTAQRETVAGEGEGTYRYHHVWGEGGTWDEFFASEVEVVETTEVTETTNQPQNE